MDHLQPAASRTQLVPDPTTNDDDPVDFVTILAQPGNGKVLSGVIRRA